MKNILFVALILVSGTAIASIPSADGTISACYLISTGAMRAIDTDALDSCTGSEAALVLQSQTPKVRTVVLTGTGAVTGDYLNNVSIPMAATGFTLQANEWAEVTVAATFETSGCSGDFTGTQAAALFDADAQAIACVLDAGDAVAPSATLFAGTVGAPALFYVAQPIGFSDFFFFDTCPSGHVVLQTFKVLITIFHG